MLLTPFIDSFFSPLILDTFFMGFYFLLFIQAIWKLLRRKAHTPYICALIILWMATTSSFLFGWVRARNAFVINNSSPETILEAFETFTNDTPSITNLVANITSDGILIWRCYTLWDRKWPLYILTPLLLTSSACNISFIALSGTLPLTILFAALASIFSATTTVIATLLIALKIILVTRNRRARYSYKKIVEILVQSAALQSSILLLDGIIALIVTTHDFPLSSRSAVVLTEMDAYTAVCSRAITGIAPTLIAFRIAKEQSRTRDNGASRTMPLSHLTFRRSLQQTDAGSSTERDQASIIHIGATEQEEKPISIDFERGLDGEHSKSTQGKHSGKDSNLKEEAIA